MFPTGTIVQLITDERLREAETARLARTGPEKPPPRRRRRLRALAARIAFATMR